MVSIHRGGGLAAWAGRLAVFSGQGGPQQRSPGVGSNGPRGSHLLSVAEGPCGAWGEPPGPGFGQRAGGSRMGFRRRPRRPGQVSVPLQVFI